VTAIGLSQIAGGQFLQVYGPRNWINCGQAGPLGWTVPAALGVVAADPNATVVGLSGDYDFQFLIEELAVGAQFNLPYVHVVVNNSYLGLIRQAPRKASAARRFKWSSHRTSGRRWYERSDSRMSTRCPWWSRSSWRRSPTSRWAPRSTTSSSSTISPKRWRMRRRPRQCCYSTRPRPLCRIP